MTEEQTVPDIPAEEASGSHILKPFSLFLAKKGLSLRRDEAATLQINLGLLCNQACKHCHLEAGPDRTEIMDEATMDRVVDFAGRNRFSVIDITGGAPELHPHLTDFIERLAPLTDKLLVRSNLSALEATDPEGLIERFKQLRVGLVASLPALNKGQTEGQRGRGVFNASLNGLKRLNRHGYGLPGSPLELNLVSNPAGAFLPPEQSQAEKRFRSRLEREHAIRFHRLFTFANVPLGRFRSWLKQTGNLERYLNNLASSFNPCALEGVMCRSMISVGWTGELHDCDFNLALGIPLSGKRTHISEVERPPAPGTPIAVGEHCYTCTAGAGFT
jgi:radical SAM/Cys-rich protein